MNLYCHLDLENNYLIFHKALQLMMYHPIKFGCKKISSSENMVVTVIFYSISPHYDPKFEDSKPILVHDTLANDVASPYKVWLQEVPQLRRYCPDEHLMEFWTFSVTLTLTTTEIQSFHKTIHLTMMHHKTKFSCKRISSSDKILKSCILIIISFTVTLIFLKDSLHYIMMH